MRRFAVLLGCLVLLAGCAPAVGTRADGARVEYYIGFVRVYRPPTDKGLTALSVKNLGIAAGSDFSVGYEGRDEVYLAPDQCRIVVIIRAEKELDHALDQLRKLGRDDLCSTQLAPSP